MHDAPIYIWDTRPGELVGYNIIYHLLLLTYLGIRYNNVTFFVKYSDEEWDSCGTIKKYKNARARRKTKSNFIHNNNTTPAVALPCIILSIPIRNNNILYRYM